MSTANNNLQGFLQVFAQKSLEQFIASMPNYNLFAEDFSTDIANGGTSITTRFDNTVYGAPNDLSSGTYANTTASSQAVTATLKLRDMDHAFNELQWATITPEVLTRTFFPSLAKQLANGIVVDAISNVTSSYFTNTITVNSSSQFTVTGSNSIQAVATTLSNYEIPEEDRYAIVTPNIYQSLTNGILPTYVYGQKDVVQDYSMTNLLGFTTKRYARLYGATLPQGGVKYSGGDKLVGIAGNKQGLVVAVRQPLEINNGLVQSAIAVDKTSGLSLHARMVYDVAVATWRIMVVSVYATAAGNPNAIVPIITLSV